MADPHETFVQKAADNLIIAIAHGDMSALETLYNAMYCDIYGYLLSMLGGDRQNAEDLAQDTFLRVYKYAPHFTPNGCGKSWVYKIAGRLALTFFKKQAAHPTELPDELPDHHSAEEAALDAQLVTEAMRQLSEDERQVVSLHAVSGLTLAEIAAILGAPLGTVKWRHARAIGKLKNILGNHF